MGAAIYWLPRTSRVAAGSPRSPLRVLVPTSARRWAPSLCRSAGSQMLSTPTMRPAVGSDCWNHAPLLPRFATHQTRINPDEKARGVLVSPKHWIDCCASLCQPRSCRRHISTLRHCLSGKMGNASTLGTIANANTTTGVNRRMRANAWAVTLVEPIIRPSSRSRSSPACRGAPRIDEPFA